MKYPIFYALIILILLNAIASASANNDFGSSKFDIIAILKSSELLKAEKKALNILPEKRSVSKITYNQSTTFNAYGYSIAIPWNKNLTTLIDDAVSVIFSVNNFVVCLDNPKNIDWTTENNDNLKKYGLMDFILTSIKKVESKL